MGEGEGMIDHTCNESIFEIYMNRGCIVPFKVKRWTWAPESKMVVTGVTIKKYPYGDAFGYFEDGSANPQVSKISCAGCVQWREVE
jgi:hypothetical protein